MTDTERTPLRKEFFGIAMTDPYAAMISKMYRDAWCRGYKRGHADGVDGIALGDWDERDEMAMAELTAERNRAEAEFVMALAALGPIVPRSKLLGRDAPDG